MPKSPDAFRTISEVADWLDTPAHVLRFWESKFTQVKPVKRAGGRRYYRPADMLLLGGIKKLLHDDGLTIKGAQKLLREHGVKHVASLSQQLDDDLVEEAGYELDVQPEPEIVTPPEQKVVSFRARSEAPSPPQTETGPEAADPAYDNSAAEDQKVEEHPPAASEAPATPVQGAADEAPDASVQKASEPASPPQDAAVMPPATDQPATDQSALSQPDQPETPAMFDELPQTPPFEQDTGEAAPVEEGDAAAQDAAIVAPQAADAEPSLPVPHAGSTMPNELPATAVGTHESETAQGSEPEAQDLNAANPRASTFDTEHPGTQEIDAAEPPDMPAIGTVGEDAAETQAPVDAQPEAPAPAFGADELPAFMRRSAPPAPSGAEDSADDVPEDRSEPGTIDLPPSNDAIDEDSAPSEPATMPQSAPESPNPQGGMFQRAGTLPPQAEVAAETEVPPEVVDHSAQVPANASMGADTFEDTADQTDTAAAANDDAIDAASVPAPKPEAEAYEEVQLSDARDLSERASREADREADAAGQVAAAQQEPASTPQQAPAPQPAAAQIYVPPASKVAPEIESFTGPAGLLDRLPNARSLDHALAQEMAPHLEELRALRKRMMG